MSFDFPNSPTPGSVYSPAGGPSYTWDGQKWVMTGSAITYTPAYDQRNRVCNPAMQISQENGTGTISTNLGYPADQWTVIVNGITVAVRRIAGTSLVSNPWYLNLAGTAKASLAAGDFWLTRQNIEGIRLEDFLWGTANAQKAVLRFNFFTDLPGTYAARIANGAGNRSWVGNFTAPSGWSTQSFSVPGDTTGTWPTDTSLGMILDICTATGTTYVAPVAGWNAGTYFAAPGVSNGVSVNSNHAVAQVGLYLDPTGSGIAPAWEMPDEAQELAACQRYWFKTTPQTTAAYRWCGAASAGIIDCGSISYTTMRTAPTVVELTAPTYTNSSALAVLAASTDAALRLTGTAIGWYRAASGVWSFSARM